MQQQPRRWPGFDKCVETKLRWDVYIRPWPPGWSFWRRIYTSRGSERVNTPVHSWTHTHARTHRHRHRHTHTNTAENRFRFGLHALYSLVFPQTNFTIEFSAWRDRQTQLNVMTRTVSHFVPWATKQDGAYHNTVTAKNILSLSLSLAPSLSLSLQGICSFLSCIFLCQKKKKKKKRKKEKKNSLYTVSNNFLISHEDLASSLPPPPPPTSHFKVFNQKQPTITNPSTEPRIYETEDLQLFSTPRR